MLMLLLLLLLIMLLLLVLNRLCAFPCYKRKWGGLTNKIIQRRGRGTEELGCLGFKV